MTSNGLSGLYNLGNTCYMNSFLQILSHSYLFKNELEYRINNNYINVRGILKEWIELDTLLWSKDCIIKPNRFFNEIQTIAKQKNLYNFCGYEQNDVTEFMLFIFEEFHKLCKTDVIINIKGIAESNCDKIALKCYKSYVDRFQNDYSLIIKLFYSLQMTYNRRVSDDEIISMCYDSNFIINIPLLDNKVQNLTQCIDLYLKDNLLCGENALYDEKTKQKCDIIQKTIFWDLPEILIISFKRYSYDGTRKNNSVIQFPIENFNMNKYVYNYKKDNYVYDLYAVCNHSGRLEGGHYTSYIKNKDGSWYHFNDTNITKLKNTENIISPKAYCLFYNKKY